MDTWWHRDVIDAGKLPLMLCFLAFVVTFIVTRSITRLIRAGRGPFRDRVTSGGTHIHHAVPGVILLSIGAVTAVAATTELWGAIAATMVGIGISLVLDEFALILHLTDVYWSNEGRLSVDMVSLAAACLGLVLVGFSPIGVDDVGGEELAVRLTGAAFLTLHLIAIVFCLLKGKYAVATFGIFISPIALVGALRIGRPTSIWAKRRYSETHMAKAKRRAATFDRRFDPVLRRWQNLVGGSPSKPDPPADGQPPTQSDPVNAG